MCMYSFYNERENSSRLYCKLTNDICMYSKFCTKQNKYIHREGEEKCFMALEANKKQIPNGAYYVRFVRKGYVYIEIDDKVIKVKDTIGNIDNYVYLQDNNGEYKISLTPFECKLKRQYKKKKI